MKFRFQRKYLSLPYILFFLFFVIVPIFLIVFYAFTDKNTGAFSFSNVIKFFNDSTNVNVLIISLTYAILNTILCLFVGYPVAFFLADKKINKSAILVTLFIMPMWINFVIRTGATRDLLNWLNISGGTYPELATLKTNYETAKTEFETQKETAQAAVVTAVENLANAQTKLNELNTAISKAETSKTIKENSPSGMTTLTQTAVELAYSQLGVYEDKGDNRGTMEKYGGRPGDPWCASFV
jgi:hypothetical protein